MCMYRSSSPLYQQPDLRLLQMIHLLCTPPVSIFVSELTQFVLLSARKNYSEGAAGRAVAELRAGDGENPASIAGDELAAPCRRRRHSLQTHVAQADVLEPGPLDPLQERRPAHVHADDVADGDAGDSGEGRRVPALVGVVVGSPAEPDRNLHPLHGDVGDGHVGDVSPSSPVGLQPDSGGRVPDMEGFHQDVAYPAGHLAADSDPGAGGRRPGDPADDDVGAGSTHRHAVVIPPALHGHQIVAALYVAVLDADVRARICSR